MQSAVAMFAVGGAFLFIGGIVVFLLFWAAFELYECIATAWSRAKQRASVDEENCPLRNVQHV